MQEAYVLCLQIASFIFVQQQQWMTISECCGGAMQGEYYWVRFLEPDHACVNVKSPVLGSSTPHSSSPGFQTTQFTLSTSWVSSDWLRASLSCALIGWEKGVYRVYNVQGQLYTDSWNRKLNICFRKRQFSGLKVNFSRH